MKKNTNKLNFKLTKEKIHSLNIYLFLGFNLTLVSILGFIWMKSSFVSDQLDIVYVDERIGTNNSLCGINRTTPCKDLSEGVRRTKEDGTIYIIGNHHLTNTVHLRKSIKIIADNTKGGGKLTTIGSDDVAFKLKCRIIKVMNKKF